MAPVAASLRLAGGFPAAALWVWLLAWAAAASAGGGNFYQEVDVTWGDGRGKILDGGRLLTLSLDRASGAGFQSKSEYLYGRFDVQLKLVSGDSAGTVTSFYLSSEGGAHDEVDFEFLGNLTGDPYVVHTNIYAQGKGGREQQFYLWFDPTGGFHTYSILWNPRHVVFYVDGTPIREFRNEESAGGAVPFPEGQPMRVYGSLWNADDWATRGGLVKTDWSKAPFVASYKDFRADACRSSSSGASSSSSCGSGGGNGTTLSQELSSAEQARLRWVRKNYMVYDYCADVKRFPQGLPPECTRS